MENLLAHVKTQLGAIRRNFGTELDPVLRNPLKVYEEDEGQFDNKVSVQLPAAIYDITDMAYSQSGEQVGVADTEITIRLAFKKNDSTRYTVIKEVTRALVGTSGTNFTNLMKESQRRVSYDDIFEYRLTFGCMLIDTSAVPAYTEIDKPEFVPEFRIR